MKTLILSTLVALVVAASAQAHYGHVWYTTAQNASRSLRDKYDVDPKSFCVPLIASDWARYDVHYINSGFGRKYDHLVCGLWSNVTGRACIAVMHITGKQWYQVVLTSFRNRGCTPADIRQR